MLDRLTIENDKVVAEEPLLTDLQARIRDVRVGPDGAVYVLTDSGTGLYVSQHAANKQAVETHTQIASTPQRRLAGEGDRWNDIERPGPRFPEALSKESINKANTVRRFGLPA